MSNPIKIQHQLREQCGDSIFTLGHNKIVRVVQNGRTDIKYNDRLSILTKDDSVECIHHLLVAN